ncbi:hypothetical protein Mycsm_06571 (plasmid) [Mycobacterium sp. JS623]|uniref:DUF2235 domain-containing protein n=1 Tax=Mycobacterium sp. JS623 TaxID=212767 RepID=UPI0002A562F1|nr:DUF2235 domain-containing protein [Mycobacterium sp. JS623]AGB26708.1 hypothetical protein Mycsm_06571 [Mycobacterium sp. JS623]
MAKNIVVCLDGTNNQLRAADNTNVVRLFNLLDLKDPTKQVAYYDPGVGTFSSPGAWSPPARLISRYAGLMFGAGLRENLGQAYSFLMEAYEPEDRIFVFGFSRGAYNARALTGMLDVFGVFRPGSETLVPYAVNAYAKQQRKDDPQFFEGLRVYAETHSVTRDGHTPVHFVGIWDTVKSAGTLTRQLKWPFTRQLPHAKTIRHAVAIDEIRRPFAPYLVNLPNPKHLRVEKNQDLLEVWFTGVHSDVGGMFAEGTRLSDIPLKWMADEAVASGLLVRPNAYAQMSQLDGVDPTGPWHKMPWVWQLLGSGRRTVPETASIHASVRERVAKDPTYANRLPQAPKYVCDDWRSPRPVPQA